MWHPTFGTLYVTNVTVNWGVTSLPPPLPFRYSVSGLSSQVSLGRYRIQVVLRNWPRVPSQPNLQWVSKTGVMKLKRPLYWPCHPPSAYWFIKYGGTITYQVRLKLWDFLYYCVLIFVPIIQTCTETQTWLSRLKRSYNWGTEDRQAEFTAHNKYHFSVWWPTSWRIFTSRRLA